jgi:hypothetical protein
MLSLTHSLPMATSEIPQTPANFDLGSRHTHVCNSLRVIEIGFESVITGWLTSIRKNQTEPNVQSPEGNFDINPT